MNEMRLEVWRRALGQFPESKCEDTFGSITAQQYADQMNAINPGTYFVKRVPARMNVRPDGSSDE